MSSPPKYNYLKQMTGRSIDKPHNTNQRKNYANHRTIYPSKGQEITLKYLFGEELKLYNNFVINMQARMRTTPEFYANLGERHRMLFIKMARIGFDVNITINRKSKNVELPPTIEPYRDILFGIIDGKETKLDEKLLIFYDVCKHKAVVLPDTREAMAEEFINFFISQCTTKDNAYTLSEVNNMQKRHIQLRKSQVITKTVSNKTEHDMDIHTEIKIPHIKSPFIMKENINDISNWNILIIHKDPSQLDLGNTKLDWIVDFKHTNEKYLLKYLETPNPTSKMSSRFIKR